ncbi:MAG: tape measure protein [Rubrivivax sp.]|nr:tape measure protein [Rubrivivax sp.]
MATRNRDVRIGVAIETTGEAGIQDLAAELRQAATAGGEFGAAAARWAKQLDDAAAATTAARDAERQRRTEATATQKELNESRDALARLQAETDRATKNTTEYREAERTLRLAVVEGNIALRGKRDAVKAAADASRSAVASEQQLAETIRRTSTAARESAREQTGGLEGLKAQYTQLRNVIALAYGGTLAGSMLRDLSQTADAVAGLRARLSLVVGEGAALEQAFEGVLAVAQRTGTALESTGTLFTRIAQAGREFNLAQADALALTEAINQAVAVSGASAASSDAAITQLIQGLQSGVLRGEEFNSVMEQAPRLARALADALGVTTGELRTLAQQGALTTDVVIKALQSQRATLEAEFNALPQTVGRAITNLSTAWTAYVGEVDGATGASKAAAAAIDLVARNLETLGSVLYAAGKAAAALAAVRLASTFLDYAAAARTASVATAAATAATTAHTAATAANTAAQTANAAATAGTVAAAGRLAGVLATLKTFTFLGVVTNLREIGTWLGETAAKWAGYGKAIEDAERAARADEAASREQAAAKAALAAQMQQATDAALGLTKAAKGIVGEFDQVVTKGGSVAEALEKIRKELDLSDVRGIQTAGAALDALALRGKITADQLRETLGAALKGDDLGRFEALARAAFDGSVQGVRRLQAALDALADESLRRAGTSAGELATGFSAAATAAINDVDALARTLRDLKAPADEAGRALGAALDKALQAAGTERAVRAVLDRVEDLGRSGELAGERFTEALTKTRTKLDEVRSGVNSLDEALRVFGIKTRAEMQSVADNLGRAWERIRDDSTVALDVKRAAFVQYANAAIAANDGVIDSQTRSQAQALKLAVEVDATGKTIVKAMDDATEGTDRLGAGFKRLGAEVDAVQRKVVSLSRAYDEALAKRNATVSSTLEWEGRDAAGNLDRNYVGSSGGSTYTPPPDNSGDWVWQATASRPGGEWVLTPEASARRFADQEQSRGLVPARDPSGSVRFVPPTPAPAPTPPAPAPARAPAPAAAPSRVVEVRLQVAAQTFPVTADEATAEAMLRAIEDAQRMAGYR